MDATPLSMRDFERLKIIGQGSFGSAILVRHKQQQVFYVVKQINVAEMSEKERGDAVLC